MDICEIQASFQTLLMAETAVTAHLAALRKLVGDSIRSVSMPGVTPIPGTVNCCRVTFSAIVNSKTLCLSPEYYLQEAQASAVDRVLATKHTASAFLAALDDMVHSGCAKKGNTKTPLNDETLGVLRALFNALNISSTAPKSGDR